MRIPIASFGIFLLLTASLASAADGPEPATVIAPGGSQGRMALQGERLVVVFVDASGAPAIAVSKDSGRTFAPPVTVPIPEPLGAPDVAFTAEGDLLVASGSSSKSGSPLLVRSADGGGHFAEAYAAYRQIVVGSDPRLTVDAGASSARAGSVYLSTWDYPFDYYGGFDVGASADSGKTFQDPGLLTYDRASAMAIAPNGDVYVAARAWISPSMRTTLLRSTDGGRTFSHAGTQLIVPVVPPDAGSLALAVDDQGIIHLAFTAMPAGSTGDRSDVFYTRSTDGGATFGPPARLNDDAGQAGQTSPRIALAPDGSGTVAVSWRDRRNDPTDDVAADVYMCVSRDRGVAFGPNRRVSAQTWLEDRSIASTWSSPPDGAFIAGSGVLHTAWTDAARGVLHARIPLDEPGGSDFGVSVTPYAAVLAGRSLQLEIGTWAVHGFTGDVRLAVEGASGGPACTLESSAVAAGDGTTLTIAPSATTPAGVYLVTLAASSGDATRRTDLRVNVYDAAREATIPLNVSSSRGDATTDPARPPSFDAAGTLTVPYADDAATPSNAAVFLRRSSDGGRTFSDPTLLPGDAPTALTVCPSGTIYSVRTATGTDDNLVVTRSADGGATFQPVDRAPQVDSGLAAVACAGDGSVAVVWVTNPSSSNPQPPLAGLVASISRDGTTFADPVSVEPDTPASKFRFVSAGAAWGANGTLWVLSARFALGNGYAPTTVRLSAAEKGKGFHFVHEFVGQAAGAGTIPSAWPGNVALAADGTMHVGWMSSAYDPSRGRVSAFAMASSSPDGGATFRDVALSVSDTSDWTVRVTPAGHGETIALWTLGGRISYARSLDSGRTYSAAANLSASPGVSSSPAAAADPSGNVFATWTDTSRGHPQVFGAWIPALASPVAPLAAFIDSPSVDLRTDAGTDVAFRGFGTGAVNLAPHWDFGDGTSADSEAASHSYAVPGTFTAVFTVTDAAGRAASASRRVTVRVPAPTGEDSELVLPVVADTDGRNSSRFTTDVTLVSRAAARVTVLLEYTAVDGRGSGVATLLLEPGQERLLPDVLGFLRERGLAIPAGGAVGSLRVVFRGARSGEAWAFARTSTPCGGGRCGVAYGAARASSLTHSVVGLQENGAMRSNLALVNLGEEPVTLRVTLLGPSGETLRVLPDRIVSPFGWEQIDRPFLGLAAAGRAVVTRVAGSSTFFAYGVLNDQTTSDGSFLLPVSEAQASDRDRLLPVVLDATGLAGSRYLTELTLANLTDAPLSLTLSFGAGAATVTLAAGQQVIEPDAIAYLRRIGVAIPPGGAAGSLLASGPSSAAGFALLARTYTTASSGGTYGASYAGLLASESAAREAWVFGLKEDASTRSNLGLVNRGDAGDAITLEISFFDSEGTALGAPLAITLASLEWRQIGRPLAAAGASEGYVRIVRTTGSSRFVAYGVLNDAATNDGSILPMTVAP